MTAAGWVHRDIELWSPRSHVRPRTAGSAEPGRGEGAGVDLSQLAQKDTLTAVEAMALLNAMGP